MFKFDIPEFDFKSFLVSTLKQFGRILPDLIISGFLLFVFISGSYLTLAPVIQTIGLKGTLVSLGFVHAHITRKICFPKINWEDDNVHKFKKVLAIALYIIFIYCWSHGG